MLIHFKMCKQQHLYIYIYIYIYIYMFFFCIIIIIFLQKCYHKNVSISWVSHTFHLVGINRQSHLKRRLSQCYCCRYYRHREDLTIQ